MCTYISDNRVGAWSTVKQFLFHATKIRNSLADDVREAYTLMLSISKQHCYDSWMTLARTLPCQPCFNGILQTILDFSVLLWFLFVLFIWLVLFSVHLFLSHLMVHKMCQTNLACLKVVSKLQKKCCFFCIIQNGNCNYDFWKTKWEQIYTDTCNDFNILGKFKIPVIAELCFTTSELKKDWQTLWKMAV